MATLLSPPPRPALPSALPSSLPPSQGVLHQVLPVWAERFAFTTWLGARNGEWVKHTKQSCCRRKEAGGGGRGGGGGVLPKGIDPRRPIPPFILKALLEPPKPRVGGGGGGGGGGGSSANNRVASPAVGGLPVCPRGQYV